MWAVICNKSRFRIDGVMKSSYIRITAENFGMFSNEFVIQMPQKLIGIKTAKTSYDRFYIWVTKCLVNILYP